MYSVITTGIIQGIRSVTVYVEADISDGMPMFEMVGFLSAEVKEAKERVRTALRNSGYVLPPKRITVNFIPANIRKTGSCFDLPIALAVLSAMGVIPEEEMKNVFVTGEIGLSGCVKPVNGILPMVAEAKENGIKYAMVPTDNFEEALLVKDIRILGVSSISEAVQVILQGFIQEKSAGKDKMGGKEKTGGKVFLRENEKDKQPDFSDINGQKVIKRACEVAVSGMHNLLMIGPPGAGKTMIAMRIPTILPPLNENEQMELSKIYSVSGLFSQRKNLMDVRPFRCPHHTVTAQGLCGGGAIPKPGEISLAHKGVLFLDELPEFQKNTLEVMRQPLEEKVARIVRLSGSYEYPADFMLVAAMNPCRCGFFPDMQKCRCTTSGIERYLNRISQPLLDRIDICVEASKLKFEELIGEGKEEKSADIRKRVVRVHDLQEQRFQGESFSYNSQIPATKIKKYCTLTKKREKYMEEIYQKLNLTARSYHKILKVARTIADMDGADAIETRHLNEAVCYRNIDKKFWGHV